MILDLSRDHLETILTSFWDHLETIGDRLGFTRIHNEQNQGRRVRSAKPGGKAGGFEEPRPPMIGVLMNLKSLTKGWSPLVDYFNFRD